MDEMGRVREAIDKLNGLPTPAAANWNQGLSPSETQRILNLNNTAQAGAKVWPQLFKRCGASVARKWESIMK